VDFINKFHQRFFLQFDLASKYFFSPPARWLLEPLIFIASAAQASQTAPAACRLSLTGVLQ